MATDKFEDLVKAIKESKEPVAELAVTLKKQLEPVKAKMFYSTDVNKIAFGDRAFTVKLVRRDNDIFNFNLMYHIENETNVDASCVSLSKGMLYKTSENLCYALTNALLAEDKLILNFTIAADNSLF